MRAKGVRVKEEGGRRREGWKEGGKGGEAERGGRREGGKEGRRGRERFSVNCWTGYVT